MFFVQSFFVQKDRSEQFTFPWIIHFMRRNKFHIVLMKKSAHEIIMSWSGNENAIEGGGAGRVLGGKHLIGHR